MCKAAGLGDEPRRVFAELAKIRVVDVVLPTRSGHHIRRRCVSRHKLKDTAAIRASVKSVGLAMIDLVWRKKQPFMLEMAGLAADLARRAFGGVSWCFDNTRRGWFGRVGRILRQLSDFVSQLGNLIA